MQENFESVILVSFWYLKRQVRGEVDGSFKITINDPHLEEKTHHKEIDNTTEALPGCCERL